MPRWGNAPRWGGDEKTMTETIVKMTMRKDNKEHTVKLSCAMDDCLFAVGEHCGRCEHVKYEILD